MTHLPAPRVDPLLRKAIVEFMAQHASGAGARGAPLDHGSALQATERAFDRMTVADLQVVEMNMRAKQSVKHSFDYDPYGGAR